MAIMIKPGSVMCLGLALSSATACNSTSTVAENGAVAGGSAAGSPSTTPAATSSPAAGAAGRASANTSAGTPSGAGRAAPASAATGTAGSSAQGGSGGSSTPAAGSGATPAAGSGGSSTAPAAGSGAPPAAGSGGSGTTPVAGSGGSGTAPAAGSGGTPATSGNTGTLPPITDPTKPGAFTVKKTSNVGPMQSYTTYEPTELGKDGVKHPILIWGPGAGSTPEIYETLLQHIGTHGFVIVSYNSTPQGPELNRAIDWIIEEAGKDSGPYAGKLDTTKIAMGGQSAGSLATFQAGGDERLTTTVHLNGGTFNHGDVANLIKPAFFICGDDPSKTGGDGTWESDLARPNCDADFMGAKVPVWYGVVIGSSHTTIIDNPIGEPDAAMLPLKAQYIGATTAWLRYQLAGDESLKASFVGPSCGYCADSKLWEVQQKDLQ